MHPIYSPDQQINLEHKRTFDVYEIFTVQTYALMRIVASFLFLWHGTQVIWIPVVMFMESPGFIMCVA